MFKIESYVTSILLSYVDKYVKEVNPADAQVSLWGGGMVLHNLVLKTEVLQQEISLPFNLVSGRIHELQISVPWTKIISEPIVVTIDTIECILSIKHPETVESTSQTASSTRRTDVVEAPPGYMKALVRRIVSNISVRIHNVILKYVHDDIVLSLNVKHLTIDSAGSNWVPTFADIDPSQPLLRRIVKLDDLTLCLDQTGADGKIRFFQEPLLYRCQLELRVLTRLVSANVRRASSVTLSLRSSNLAWGVTDEQLLLLLRLLGEQDTSANLQPTPPIVVTPSQTSTEGQSSGEAADDDSWSSWAWSWLPSLNVPAGEVEEVPAQPAPTPLHLAIYLDNVIFMFKVIEKESNNRRRTRGILELVISYVACNTSLCLPVMLSSKLYVRNITLRAHGKCMCGYINNADKENIIFLSALTPQTDEWSWPPQDMDENVQLEAAEAMCEEYRDRVDDNVTAETSETEPSAQEIKEPNTETDNLYKCMSPVLYLHYTHERSPPNVYINPYENPPIDFEYSDWVESCTVQATVKPVMVRVSTDLLHRANVFLALTHELRPVLTPEKSIKTLTVEECDYLLNNLPQRHFNVDIECLRVRFLPWSHSPERPAAPPLVLDLDICDSNITVTGPLYPRRVCQAACQLPEDEVPVWDGARTHVSASLQCVQLSVRSGADHKPCARFDLHVLAHLLNNPHYFTRGECVINSYSAKIKEINVCGSAARLQAAYQILKSLITEKRSMPLRYTSLVRDALHDEYAVAVDMTFEDISARRYITNSSSTYIASMHSARATALQAKAGEEVKQAWLFCAPDSSTVTPYLRIAAQWCQTMNPNFMEYIGVWTEPTAFSVDPLFITWLAYEPTIKAASEIFAESKSYFTSPSQHRRRSNAEMTAVRGASRAGSGPELVHTARGSSSEQSEKKETPPAQPVVETSTWDGMQLYERMTRTVISVELGLVLVHVTTTTASAVDCATVRETMENHAARMQRVLILSLGRFSMSTVTTNKHLWQVIKHDGPTMYDPRDPKRALNDSFPWKMRLADVSCYSLEVLSATLERERERERASFLKSTLKMPRAITPRTILELITTTVTLSIVTKTLPVRSMQARPDSKKPSNKDDLKTSYFTSGIDFKPKTLKEFLRGPVRRRSKSESDEPAPGVADVPPAAGPVIGLGVHFYANTPPLVVRLDNDQVSLVAVAIHCFTHIVSLLQRESIITTQKEPAPEESRKSLPRTASEIEEVRSPTDEAHSEWEGELISIYESKSATFAAMRLKTSFWFQWVINRVTVVVAGKVVKLSFDAEDIIVSLGLQTRYNQLKVKVAAASIKQYDRSSSQWVTGPLGGRVLEAREPLYENEDSSFLALTITQAHASFLPSNWKEMLRSHALRKNPNSTDIWEVYIKIAPLAAVLEPHVLNQIILLAGELKPKALCPLAAKDTVATVQPRKWPFCFVKAGGIHLTVITNNEDQRAQNIDDTVIVYLGRINIAPDAENPIIRRPVNAHSDAWSSKTVEENHELQYEMLIKHVTVQSTKFTQLLEQQASSSNLPGAEVPAAKWARPVRMPVKTNILNPVDINCVLAPAHYSFGELKYTRAAEVNVLLDCLIELSFPQIQLFYNIASQISAQSCRDEDDEDDDSNNDVCPYVSFLSKSSPVMVAASEDDGGRPSPSFDSGVDVDSRSNKSPLHIREESNEPLEVTVTMGEVTTVLYALENNAENISHIQFPTAAHANTDLVQPADAEQPTEASTQQSSANPTDSKINLNTVDDANLNQPNIEQATWSPISKTRLIRLKLYQPNFYYSRNKHITTCQVSLFDANLSLIDDSSDGTLPVLSTARGQDDPITGIAPALATMKYIVPTLTSASRAGNLTIEIERPIQFQLSKSRLRRLRFIHKLMVSQMQMADQDRTQPMAVKDDISLFSKLRNFMVRKCVENAVLETNQLCLLTPQGRVGCAGVSLQASAAARSERIAARALVTALVLASYTAEYNIPLLTPTTFGVEVDANWDAWRRAEGGVSAKQPTVRMKVDFDHVTIDLRPADLEQLASFQKILNEISDTYKLINETAMKKPDQTSCRPTPITCNPDQISSMASEAVPNNHYYKDDLRSGVYKVEFGKQLPIAYQVVMFEGGVAWHYPQPRAITKIVISPLPDTEEEVDLVLEMFNDVLSQWEPHTYFKLPVAETKELLFTVAPPEVVFAEVWRIRANINEDQPAYIFSPEQYKPRTDPWTQEAPPELEFPKCAKINVEQLSGALRVDSYFAPLAQPTLRASARVIELDVHLHNDMGSTDQLPKHLEGYYASRPLKRNHRVLSLRARRSVVHMQRSAPAGALLLLDTHLSSDMLESRTSTMDNWMQQTRLQAAVSLPPDSASLMHDARTCLDMSIIRASLNAYRIRTLEMLFADWRVAVQKYNHKPISSENMHPHNEMRSTREVAEASVSVLDGRVCYWLENTCTATLRFGQEDTEEQLTLGPGDKFAYRWNSPSAPKKVRFAIVLLGMERHWSDGVSFDLGKRRVLLHTSGNMGGPEVYLFVNVQETGTRRLMRLSGRLVLANIMRFNLIYQIRSSTPGSNGKRTICSGELPSESISRTVLCGDSDLTITVELAYHNAGNSGEIPLKEFTNPKIPWLVKVPCKGTMPFIAMWCRVVRASTDGRLLVALWPFYVLHSHLPLDVDAMITTNAENVEENPPPLVQPAEGRGAVTHLLTHGTTTAHHTLTLKYTNIECPVIAEAIPLHYRMSETFVFAKHNSVRQIEEVMTEVVDWLDNSGLYVNSEWPYSIVRTHCPCWRPALMQPKCEVIARYSPVFAGGGCSLRVELCPLIMVCNASPLPVTLRSYDAAPLCKLESGCVVAPPSVMLTRPFYISMEIGREVFVSEKLQVTEIMGVYEEVPRGRLALGYQTPLALFCHNKVSMFTLYYEIINEINIIGITSTFVLLNRLKTQLMVCGLILPDDDRDVALHPHTYKTVPPTNENSIDGTCLSQFMVQGHVRDHRFNLFLCLALADRTDGHDQTDPTDRTEQIDWTEFAHAPVQLSHPPHRKQIALWDKNNDSVAVVVTQVKHEGRWLISVSPDPCPQFVIHNFTKYSIAVAQPKHKHDGEVTLNTQIEPDSASVSWFCVLEPGRRSYYTTPEYTARFPHSTSTSFCKTTTLTFAKFRADNPLFWCNPMSVVTGEHLLQFFFGHSIKMRVQQHPHSTLIELRDVHELDISAIEIRRRLEESDFQSHIENPGLPRSPEKVEITNVSEKRRMEVCPTEIYVKSYMEEPILNNSHELLLSSDLSSSDHQLSDCHPCFTPPDTSLSDSHPVNHLDYTTSSNSVETIFSSEMSPRTGKQAAKHNPLSLSAKNLITKQRQLILKSKRSLFDVSPSYDVMENSLQGEEEKILHEVLTVNSEMSRDVNIDDATVQRASLVPIQTIQPSEATQPTEPMQPSKPIQPTEPTQPIKPTEPTQPIKPTEPTQPIQPILRDSDVCSMAGPSTSARGRARLSVRGLLLQLASSPDHKPLFALRAMQCDALVDSNDKITNSTISIGNVQIENMQYDLGQYDFAVVATTGSEDFVKQQSPLTPLWNMFLEEPGTSQNTADKRKPRMLLELTLNTWTVAERTFTEITELEIGLGPISLYIEDAYVLALTQLFLVLFPTRQAAALHALVPLAEEHSMTNLLRLRKLVIHPIDLTLTLHTAVRIYIALDHSPLHLSAFQVDQMMTSLERLSHALTVHYLSTAILGAGWVVGGLELLGAPGVFASRVSEGAARGGVRGAAAATAAAVVRSVTVWAGSLARNLDLLAGDEDHSRRAAQQRRHTPNSAVAGLRAGITNFGINLLGAVGGLAHHSVVGVCVGESSSATALRRGLVGAFTKPLSATADLLAYVGHGLLRQTGWDPEPLALEQMMSTTVGGGWRRDCVRWMFRVGELGIITAFEVTSDTTPMLVLLTHKFILLCDLDSERILELIDYRACTLQPYDGPTVKIMISVNSRQRPSNSRTTEEENQYIQHLSAMVRVARYTGMPSPVDMGDVRTLSLSPTLNRAVALHAALAAAIQHTHDTHFTLFM